MNAFEPDLPEDFDEFWREVVDEVARAPLDYHRNFEDTYTSGTHRVETLSFRGVDGTPRNGWIAFPEGARRARSFLWIPPYGRESLLPNEYGTREGMTSLSFNFFGHAAFHQEKYTIERGYFAEGAAEPRTWVFRRMFQDAYMAARVLQAQPEADEDRIGSMGMSQGGGISIWLGAWCPVVKVVCADMPFLGAMKAALNRNAYRYPLKELIDFGETIPVGHARVLNTISYFDTMNVATRCRASTHVALGLKDPAARPENVEAIYNALAGEKELHRLDVGHDWHPEMISENKRWLNEHMP
jgi:cephalosporin-C deacetylase